MGVTRLLSVAVGTVQLKARGAPVLEVQQSDQIEVILPGRFYALQDAGFRIGSENLPERVADFAGMCPWS